MNRLTMFLGSILILMGILFLLDGLDVIQVNAWGLIFAFFIIGLGSWILWGVFSPKKNYPETANVSLENAGRARVTFQHGAGRVQVTAMPLGNDLVSGTFDGGVQVRSDRQEDKLLVKLSIPERYFPYYWGPGSTLDWNVQLASGIPLELNLDLGASNNILDLSGLIVNDLRLNSGASSTRVTMPAAAGLTKARFKTGAASLDVKIPPGVAGRIQYSAGLASVIIDRARFPKTGNVYLSTDYETSVNKADIKIETGVGSVTVS